MKKFLNLIICFVISITLVSGCSGQNNQNKYGEFVKTGNNIIKRSSHTATLLPNGNVLIAGGIDYSRHGRGYRGSDTAEIYNQKTEKFSLTGKMIEKRIHPQSILLPNGKVLIVDGVTNNVIKKSILGKPDSYISMYKIKSAELYDYKTGKFTRTGDLNYERPSGHTLTLLKDGNVLVIGGTIDARKIKKGNKVPCEIYNYKTGKFRVISAMNYYNRSDHTATLLNDGKVLITGGVISASSSINEFSNAEIFDPKTEKFTKTGKPLYKRKGATAALLNDGKVLIIGGNGFSQKEVILTDKKGLEWNRDKKTGKYYTVNKPQSSFKLNNAEVYNPNTQKFEGLINSNFGRWHATTIKLNNGKVLILGSSDNKYEEIYVPAVNKFIKIDSVGYTRGSNTLTLLKNGDILIAGGINRDRFWINNLIFKYKGE